jgi:hypothetical protein
MSSMPKRMFEQVRGLSVDLERILIIELLQVEQLIGHRAHCITNGYEIRRKMCAESTKIVCSRTGEPDHPNVFRIPTPAVSLPCH